MELVVEELDALRRKLKITIPKDVVKKKINDAYKELNSQIVMPGFRAGKIPLAILEKQAPIQSFTQMFQGLLQEYYEKALQESGITPVGNPEIEHESLKEIKKDEAINFSVILDIKPAIEPKPYKGIKLKKREISVTDTEVDAAIGRLLEAHGHFEVYEKAHAAQKGDHLLMDFEGAMHGEPLEGGSAKGYCVRIGEKKMIAGFEDQLIGHKRGEEFAVEVVLPSDWNKKMRRASVPIPGATEDKEQDVAAFKVKITEVKKLIVPELTDDFARHEGVDTVADMRRKIKTDLQAFKEQQQDTHLKSALFEKLVDENNVNPPESLVKHELTFMIDGAKFQIRQSGMKLEDSGFDEEQAEKEWRGKAEKNTKGYMILEAIADKEKIHVTESDFEGEYKILSEQTGQKPGDIKRRLLSNRDSFNQTKSKLRGQKTLNYVFSHCEFEYVKGQPEETKIV